jgi:hypothetical protein
MLLSEREIQIPQAEGHRQLLKHVADAVSRELAQGEVPVRFAVTRTTPQGYHCELATLTGAERFRSSSADSIFATQIRDYEHTDRFRAVLLIPTGIGAALGGHSGDGGPLARLLAGACDTLITHPNVVNGADINALPENGLYVEGSVITRFLAGSVGLQPVRSNRVMMVIDDHRDPFFSEAAINSVSAARAAMGMDCPLVLKMQDKVLMRSLYASSGRAVGRIEHLQRLCEVLSEHRDRYDAVAISSMIQVPEHFHGDYFREDMAEMVNPWGGVEAMLTHAVSVLFDVPSAHSPMLASKAILDLDVGVVDPRKSAETVSTTFLHCILQGLHKSPRIVPSAAVHGSPGLLTAADVSCLVIPDGCVGLPTLAALEQGIPVIAVKENTNCMKNDLTALPWQPGKLFVVDNYLEAVGVMSALRSGVALDSVRRPIADTNVSARPSDGICCLEEDVEDTMAPEATAET